MANYSTSPCERSGEPNYLGSGLNWGSKPAKAGGDRAKYENMVA